MPDGTAEASISAVPKDTMISFSTAARYLERGLAPIPIPTRSKNPNRPGWQDERWTADELVGLFTIDCNIGVLNGDPSNGVVDIDLDCNEAVTAAPALLPTTGCIFGRESRRASHYVYRVAPLLKTTKYADPLTRQTLVEIRSTGSQTVWPGSVHPSGEPITFDVDYDITVVDSAELARRVEQMAAVALLARSWPKESGCRHDLALALAGDLLRAGLDVAVVDQVIGLSARIAGDAEWTDRATAVRTTAHRQAAGAPTTGRPTLDELLDPKVTRRLRSWLRGVNVTPAPIVEPVTVPEPAAATVPVADIPSLTVLLTTIEQLIAKYIVIPNAGLVAVVLWIAHTHAIDAVEVTPYLHIRSPQPRCGKSRLLEVLAALVRRAWVVVQPSEAVLYRKVAKDEPTLMLDEVDAIFGKASETTEGVRALLNAGNRRGTTIPRCQAKSLELVEFPVFCAKCLAGIGTLPTTVADRSIPITLARRKPGEHVTRLRARQLSPEAIPLHAQLTTWSIGAVPHLKDATPPLPDALNDRAQDAWEPLLAIADLAGNGWPERARAAAVALHGAVDDEDTIGVQLLRAIAETFATGRTERMFTKDLLEALVGRDSEPWGAWWGAALDKGDTRGPGHKLAKLLKPFGIASKTIRIDGHSSPGKGYEAADFSDACTRYAFSTVHNVTTSQPLGDKGLWPEGEGYSSESVTSEPRPQTLAAQELSPCNVAQGEHAAPEDTQTTVAHVPKIFPGARAVEDVEPASAGVNDDRATLIKLAARHGWPMVPLRPGCDIWGTEICWRTFVSTAILGDRLAARAYLEHLGRSST